MTEELSLEEAVRLVTATSVKLGNAIKAEAEANAILQNKTYLIQLAQDEHREACNNLLSLARKAQP